MNMKIPMKLKKESQKKNAKIYIKKTQLGIIYADISTEIKQPQE